MSAIKRPEENMMRIKTQGTLTASGQLRGTSELSFGGANDDRYRGSVSI